MEKFKAVEKAMKTKAYSKEGLSAAAKLDPKEQAKVEAGEFLSSMVDELEQQIEALEAESEQLSATTRKGKLSGAKAERIARVEEIIERHKWHQGKLELIRRSLENGGVDTDQVTDLEENIRYYVSDGMNDDFMEDDEMYDELNLEDDEGNFGMGADGDKGSSQDNQSVTEETPEPEPVKPVKKPVAEPPVTRKPSVQTKSPLPALATLHTPLATISNGNTSNSNMKPATVPARPAEGLKYASAAAAAAASDRNNVGISPLPPPPGVTPLQATQARSSAASSPAITAAQPVSSTPQPPEPKQQPAAAPATDNEMPAPVPKSKRSKAAGKQPVTTATSATESSSDSSAAKGKLHKFSECLNDALTLLAPHTNGVTNGIKPIEEEPDDEESIYHLPSSLQDLVESYEASKRRTMQPLSQTTQRLMAASQVNCPDAVDADTPRTYRPDMPVPPTASGFPRDPLPIFDDPRLYGRIDPDTLFYVFYYKQGSPQQYLAAKALKDQSWRFHKQYQTWFQRHEEPKNITEEFEQGTYRFFDYESTW
jgi:CCR4-NOT transcription complex subunit 3